MHTPPVMLVIFDGFGVNPSRLANGWALARTPHLDYYFASYPHTVLEASGLAVGLPDGQFGDSEVGHLTLGAGRVLNQFLVRISQSLMDGSFARLPVWRKLVHETRRLHLVGLVSDGGVHSSLDHLLKIIPLVVEAGIEPILHMVTDGRDTSTHCALAYVAAVNAAFATAGQGRIASVSGRFYAMDRAGHWDRTEQAWKAMVRGEGLSADTAETAIQNAYARGESDEFITPTMIGDHPIRIEADEFILTLNFRSDRMRQLVAALGLSDFTEFGREADEIRQVVTMVEYENTFPFPVLFSSEMPSAVLAEVLSEAHLLQFHCAETEKYPHVTYFFNGGQDAPFAGEARQMIPSPAVLTYDLQPEMSAEAVADAVVAAVERQEYQFIVVNFANGDMVGHTAVPAAIIQAVETLDLQFHRVVQAALRHQFRVILTADHGNCDEMVDAVTNKPHTRHTPYPVPFLLIGQEDAQLGTGRSLADVAPTILRLLGLAKPKEMTGQSIILSQR